MNYLQFIEQKEREELTMCQYCKNESLPKIERPCSRCTDTNDFYEFSLWAFIKSLFGR